MTTTRVEKNTPVDDDPENRYDCLACMYAPEADEDIVLVLDGDVVQETYCLGCAEEEGIALPATDPATDVVSVN